MFTWLNAFVGCIVFAYHFTTSERCPSHAFGTECRFQCHCMNQSRCDSTGVCSRGCQLPLWTGDICQMENIALLKPTAQKNGPGSKPSRLAVDGDPVTCSRSHPMRPGRWMVDLKRKISFLRINITTEATSSVYEWHVLVGASPELWSMRTCALLESRARQMYVTCDVGEAVRYIGVVNTLSPVMICDFQVLVCARYRYGEKCEHECTCRDPYEDCHEVYGTCKSGCRNGKYGNSCQKACDMTYGHDCLFECGHCSPRTSCDPENGHCKTKTCAQGWRGPRCDIMCLKGTYGENCHQTCGHCRYGDTCHHATGLCPKGCAAGWSRKVCNKACDKGSYGEDCYFTCGHCSVRNSCNVTTGLCPRRQGCEVGWRGIFCTLKCLRGAYGEGCSRRCYICKSLNCEHITGRCLSGCQPGFTGSKCETKCAPGTYGAACKEKCGHCSAGDMCSHTNGSCPGSCIAGYSGSNCKQACKAGYYGSGCKKCGFCLNLEPCNNITGVCRNGCGDGYDGDLCQDEIVFTERKSPYLASVLSLVLVPVVLVLTCVLGCMMVKWRQEDTYPFRHQWLPE